MREYLPQVDVKAHTTILSTTSRTTLTQKFVVPSKTRGIKKLQYTFPLFDGVSVVGFKCTIGDRVIVGEVQEKEQARKTYDEAVERGETAGLLEQLPEASDVFITSVGNVPPNSVVLIDITYLGELKHDAEVDGVRFTIPAIVSPRYGDYPGQLASAEGSNLGSGRFEAIIDTILEDSFFIREMRSPTHPIAVSLGTVSTAANANPSMNKASATLSLGSAELSQDFIVQIVSKEFGSPTAVLETHPTIPSSRALMTTLVPRFELPQQRPEIVFICDRSASMAGSKIVSLSKALQIFIKSLPVGVVFNICSFGSNHEFLWQTSKPYNKENMHKAMNYVRAFKANLGGTSMLEPVKDTLNRRHSDRSLEVFLVTDGEIWDQQTLFDLLNERILIRKEPVRVFTLGIGDAVSHALIEGVARAGDGFSQSVGNNEKFDSKVVRMLKAALFPHVNDYKLEVKYEKDEDDEFEHVEKITSTFTDNSSIESKPRTIAANSKKVISLFDTSAQPEAPIDQQDTRSIPRAEVPLMLQAPQRISQLYPFSRTTVYVLMSPHTSQRKPKSFVLRGTSDYGPLELEIPIRILDTPSETIHQLAAKKAVLELEEGRGWLQEAKTDGGLHVKDKYPSHFDEIVRFECVRLGTTFQIGGKNCSFVAVEREDTAAHTTAAEDFEFVDVGSLVISDRDNTAATERSRAGNSNPFAPVSLFQSSASAPPPLEPSQRGGLFGSAGGFAGFGGPSNPPAAASGMFGMPSDGQMKSGTSTAGSFSMFGGTPAFAQPSPDSLFASAPIGPSSIPMFSFAPAKPSSNSLFASASANAPSTSTGLFNTAPQKTMRQQGYAAVPFGAPSSVAAPTGTDKNQKFQVFGSAMPQLSTAPAPASAPAPAPAEFEAKRKTSRRSSTSSSEQVDGDIDKDASCDEDADDAINSDATGQIEAEDPLHTLIEMQTFEGYWEWNEALFKVLGNDSSKVVSPANKNAVATALAVQYLETKLAHEMESWELIVEKAKSWLQENVEAAALQELYKVARRIII